MKALSLTIHKLWLMSKFCGKTNGQTNIRAKNYMSPLYRCSGIIIKVMGFVCRLVKKIQWQLLFFHFQTMFSRLPATGCHHLNLCGKDSHNIENVLHHFKCYQMPFFSYILMIGYM